MLDESRAVLVNAAVGSGKTTVLIAKALYEHTARGVPLREMAVLTFTNKAADEIRERMRAADPDAGDEETAWFGTFHSVALRLLQQVLPVGELGFTPSFAVLAPDEELELAERLIGTHGLCVKYRNKLIKRMEAFASGRSLYGVMKREDDIGRLCELLAAEKLRLNAMNFDDLLKNAARLLRSAGWSPRRVIVDEFQDCDALQTELLRAMASPETKLFVVGDPNQVIYSWRGGGRDIFRRFAAEFGATELSLPVNYRSSATILEAAKFFLEDRSQLEGIRDPGAGIVVRNHYNPFLEAVSLAETIWRLHETGAPWREIAVLFRLQRQSAALEDTFARRGIPFAAQMRKSAKEALAAESENEAPSAEVDAVRLMTLHACKGLEFRCVFIVGVNYGLIPMHTSPGRWEEQEEERRLFFVGITRAKDYLELSYYTSPDDPRVMPGKSGYLSMIPARLLEAPDDAPGEADLQGYRRMILENRGKRGAQDVFGPERTEEASAGAKRTLHPRYGEGVVESEDETSYTVGFAQYGTKIFSKDFCPLEFL